jgi:hypothetical protein
VAYPFSLYFESGVAAVCTQFWLNLTAFLLKKTKYQRLVIFYVLLFIANFILAIFNVFGDGENMVKNDFFYLLLSANAIAFVVDVKIESFKILTPLRVVGYFM